LKAKQTRAHKTAAINLKITPQPSKKELTNTKPKLNATSYDMLRKTPSLINEMTPR
jgi:hypothetical protein